MHSLDADQLVDCKKLHEERGGQIQTLFLSCNTQDDVLEKFKDDRVTLEDAIMNKWIKVEDFDDLPKNNAELASGPW